MVIGILIGTIIGAGIVTILYLVKSRLNMPKKVELSDEEKEKQKKLKKSFDELMNYDYIKAIQRGDK